jgi:hypothetical protein
MLHFQQRTGTNRRTRLLTPRSSGFCLQATCLAGDGTRQHPGPLVQQPAVGRIVNLVRQPQHLPILSLAFLLAIHSFLAHGLSDGYQFQSRNRLRL